MWILGPAFAAGAWWLQQQAALPGAVPAIALAVLCALLLWLRRRFGAAARGGSLVVAVAAAVLAGYAWAGWRADLRLADHLPEAWEGRDIRIVGAVEGLPRARPNGERFDFRVERVLTADAVVPRRIALTWFDPAEPGAPALPGVRAAQRWELTVRLKRIHGSANPHAFDYEAWALERGLRAGGYVREAPPPRRLEGTGDRLLDRVHRVREALRDRIVATLADKPYAGVIAALVMGDQAAIARPQWQVFTRTGVNHLMSISGLHVTMLAGLAFAAVAAAWRRIPRLALRLPAVKAAAVAGLAAAWAYALVAGFGVPTQRTVYMVSAVALAVWVGRGSSGFAVLGWALALVVLIDPWAVISPGFWLSFGAVGWILMVAAGRIRRPHWLAGWGRIQAAVTLGLAPLLIVLFGQVSLVSPLANAFAIPLVSLAVVPLALAGAVAGDWLLVAAHELMALGLLGLEWLSRLPDAAWQQHAPPAWAAVAAVMGAAWMLMPRGFPGRGVGLLGFLPLFLIPPPQPAPGELWATVLDVGQGSAVVVRTARHAALYDAGPAFGPDADAGAWTVVPFLRGEGVRRLDMLVVSHDDLDHSGGAASVMEALPVDLVVSSLPDGHALRRAAPAHGRCVAGQSWEWDGVRFEILHPPAEAYDNPKLAANALSCVLKASGPHGSLLLPGDIAFREERALVAARRDRLRADWLLAPHHGSRFSSGEAFVEAVAARAVVFSNGYRNPFGHPRDEVVERYRVAGARDYRSDRDGAVSVRFGPGGVVAEIWRERAPRYWHGR